jgi:hypothetical protein
MKNMKEENIFETAFISVMNFLKEDGHVLFEAIVTNTEATAKYPFHRAWIKLDSLTLAWHIHQPLSEEFGVIKTYVKPHPMSLENLNYMAKTTIKKMNDDETSFIQGRISKTFIKKC